MLERQGRQLGSPISRRMTFTCEAILAPLSGPDVAGIGTWGLVITNWGLGWLIRDVKVKIWGRR